MIKLQNLSVQTGSFILHNISLDVREGTYATLMGKNGQGKTTLMEAICGLRTVTAGTIQINSVDITRWLPGDRGIGYVPQDLVVFPGMTTYDQIAFPLKIRRWPRRMISDRVSEVAVLLHLTALLSRRPDELSGGQSQRVAIGRALSFRPRVLMLDEPVSSLDQQAKNETLSLLKSIQQQVGVTTLHITHDEKEAGRMADQRFVIDNGTISEQSSLASPIH